MNNIQEEQQQYSEQLPPVRVTPAMKNRLLKIASTNPFTQNVSDHLRIAIREYINKYGESQILQN